jgi:hypothetical protein
MGVYDVPKGCRKHLRYAPLRSNGVNVPVSTVSMAFTGYLKSDGRRSARLHFSHSAIFLTFPLSKRAFILISPPQEQKNFCVVLEVRLFLLA